MSNNRVVFDYSYIQTNEHIKFLFIYLLKNKNSIIKRKIKKIPNLQNKKKRRK